MAGGKGTRLQPLSCDLPKPMVPVMNRPMLEHIIALLTKHGITDVAVTLCHLPEAITGYFGDGSHFGVRLRYYTELTPLGTAGSVHEADDFLDETFLVISGDALTDIDLTAAIFFHRERKSLATLVLTRVDTPLEYGVVITDPDGRVRRFLEKPGWSEVFSDTVNTGIYVLEPAVFSYYEKGRAFDFSKDLFPRLLAAGEALYGYVADGYWSDIGHLDQYRLSHQDCLDGKVRLTLTGVCPPWAGVAIGAEVGVEARSEARSEAVVEARAGAERAYAAGGTGAGVGVRVGEHTFVHPGAVIEPPAYVGDHCRIEEGAHVGPYAVIGDFSTVKSGAVIKRSVAWNETQLDSGSEVKGAVFADRVKVRSGAMVMEGVAVGKDTIVGPKAFVKPGVKIWPAKNIDAGVTLSTSIVWGQLSPKRIFTSTGVLGAVDAELTPENCARVGAAFATTRQPGERLVLGSDGSRAARLLKRAFVAGILSAGVHVTDLGTVTAPVARHAASALGAAGGAWLRHQEVQDASRIDFFDDKGLFLDKGRQRDVEGRFLREDLRRVPAGQVGELTFLPQSIDGYLERLLNGIDASVISHRGMKLAVAYDSAGPLALVLPTLLERIGCPPVAVLSTASLEEESEICRRLAENVVRDRLDLGILLEPDGQGLTLIDGVGRAVRGPAYWAFVAEVGVLQGILRGPVPDSGDSASVLSVPFFAPEAVDHLAERLGAPSSLRIVRTTAGQRAAHDALASLVQVLDVAARRPGGVSELFDLLPPVNMKEEVVDCPWNAKGRVMRALIDRVPRERAEFVDGIKVRHENGWALVLPDAEEPVFRVFSEATSMDEADALARYYRDQILAFRGDA